MVWNRFNKFKGIFLKLTLLICFLFVLSCSNDERLAGLRKPVVEGDVRFKSKSTNVRLDKSKNWTYWTHKGRNSKHDTGNLKFNKMSMNSFVRQKIGPSGLYSEPVVSEGKVYILTPNGYIVAYSTNGKFLWELDISTKHENKSGNVIGGLAIYDNNLIATSSIGEILSINTINKKINWRYNFKRPFRSPPIIHKNKIYALTGDDVALSLDMRGRLRWTKKGPQKATKFMTAASPAASGNKIFFPFSGGSLVALNATNGLELWRNSFENSNIGTATASLGDFGGDPVIVGSNIYSISAFGEIFSSSLNGRINWRNNISGKGRTVISGNSIFFISGDNNLVRIDKKTGEVIYKTKDLITKKRIRFIGPLLVENKLLVYSTNGYMIWFNSQTGALIQEKKIGDKISSPPILVDMKIIFVSDKGVLNIFN